MDPTFGCGIEAVPLRHCGIPEASPGGPEAPLLETFRILDRPYAIVPGTALTYEVHASSGDPEEDGPVLGRLGYGPHLPSPEPSVPVGLVLNLVRGCNLACRYCCVGPEGRYGGATDRMDAETARRSVEYLCRMSPSSRLHLILFGGEPTINWTGLRTAVLSARRRLERSWTIDLITNGTLLDPDRARFLAEHGVRAVVTLTGPSDLHDRHRITATGGPSHERVRHGVRMLQEAGAPVVLKAVITKDLRHRAEEIQEYLWTLAGPRDMVVLSPEERWASPHSNGEADAWTMWLEAVGREADGRHPPAQLSMMLDALLRGPWAPRPECSAGTKYPFVDTDGSLYICHLSGVGDPGRRLGDVLSGPLEGKIADFQRMKDRLPDRCAGCWARGLCFKLCPLYRDKGMEPSDGYCSFSKGLIRRSVDATARLTWDRIRLLYSPRTDPKALEVMERAFRLRDLARSMARILKPIHLFPSRPGWTWPSGQFLP